MLKTAGSFSKQKRKCDLKRRCYVCRMKTKQAELIARQQELEQKCKRRDEYIKEIEEQLAKRSTPTKLEIPAQEPNWKEWPLRSSDLPFRKISTIRSGQANHVKWYPNTNHILPNTHMSPKHKRIYSVTYHKEKSAFEKNGLWKI